MADIEDQSRVIIAFKTIVTFHYLKLNAGLHAVDQRNYSNVCLYLNNYLSTCTPKNWENIFRETILLSSGSPVDVSTVEIQFPPKVAGVIAHLTIYYTMSGMK